MSGMSKEFITWLVDNGFCSGNGGDECANGLEDCKTPECAVSLMWPLISYETYHAENANGEGIHHTEFVEIECVRHQEQSPRIGPPWPIVITKPLKVPMSKDMREAYTREREEHLEVTKLNERIAKVMNLCVTTRDVDLDMLPDQIVRILNGEDNAA